MPFDRIDRIDDIGSVTELWDATRATMAAEGLDFVIYLTVNRHCADPVALTNLPMIYDMSSPAQDPFLQHCCSSYDITKTGAAYLNDYPYLGARSRAFIEEASRHGFQSGLAIPMRLTGSARYGGFNLGSTLDRDTFEAQIWPQREQLRFFCLLVHRRMEELARTGTDAVEFRQLLIAPESGPMAALSPREKEMIYLLARGLARKECARLCGISLNTASDYIKSAYRKLGVRNKVEAVRLIQGS